MAQIGFRDRVLTSRVARLTCLSLCETVATMPFGRRRLRKQLDREEAVQRVAAREAIGRIVCCFTSDPDVYEVRGAIVFRPPEEDAPPDAAELMVAQMLWRDEDRTDYFLDGGPWSVIRDLVPAADESEARALATNWIGPTCRELPTQWFPGLYLNVFVQLYTGQDPPLDGTAYLWFLPPESDDAAVVVVRAFPSGIGETGPPIGEVGCVLFNRASVDELLQLRGW